MGAASRRASGASRRERAGTEAEIDADAGEDGGSEVEGKRREQQRAGEAEVGSCGSGRIGSAADGCSRRRSETPSSDLKKKATSIGVVVDAIQSRGDSGFSAPTSDLQRCGDDGDVAVSPATRRSAAVTCRTVGSISDSQKASPAAREIGRSRRIWKRQRRLRSRRQQGRRRWVFPIRSEGEERRQRLLHVSPATGRAEALRFRRQQGRKRRRTRREERERKG